MSDLLAIRIAQPDLVGLPEWQVSDILNAPDDSLPKVPVVFSCRAIAEPAVLSGELAMLRIVAKLGHIPADVTLDEQNFIVPTQGLVAIGTMLDAVDRDLVVDPSAPGAAAQVAAMLSALEGMGLLSPATKTAVLASTVRLQSWAEANGIEVTPRAVSLARGGK
ncbi:MAG: hypothetical protein ACK5X3_22440 [Pseudomonadota bacterium]|jgi:hypothetical protein